MSKYFDKMASKHGEEKIQAERNAEIEELRARISTELAEKTKNKNLFGTKDEKTVEQVKEWITNILDDSGTNLPLYMRQELLDKVLLEITSLGKIHPLIMDDEVSEVMVNAPEEVWVEKKGKLILTDIKFDDEEEVITLARKIVGHIGRRIDNSNPIVDARLPDGSRVHIVIPPISMKGTTITIRKFFQEKLGIDDLVNFGTVDETIATFLESAVKARSNIVVSGGTGSGKTTTLNIMSNFVPDDERIITIEDSAELQLSNDHVVKLESRPANAEGTGEITIQDLIKASLRMRPERVIVGEVRDGSALDLLQAMNTGHDGSMGTTHSNSPKECVSRIATLVLYAGYKIPDQAIKEQIAGAVDLIVQISRLKDGSRKITHISEVVEYIPETEQVRTEPIFIWKLDRVNEDGKLEGHFEYTGYRPTNNLLSKFEKYSRNFDSLTKGSEA
ncbi:CpaF family protein (plasmid) [Pontibacillus sp. ALD_SL1]|uniref:CpaF family protein n=1 Tax=Pontibacillus sp. ALD_SL1 TaxID=2777185 RepID=UPI001A96ED61|nr:CpaF family protein [Pontibacillus sp. ALD_SL1]QST02980.1 CpaF family protein [Pontibacillus sp. ALD_SL1]